MSIGANTTCLECYLKKTVETARSLGDEQTATRFCKELMGRLASNEYDLVLVNIVADVIIGLAPILPNFLTEKSILICSGILDTRLDDVTAALEQAGLTIHGIRAKEDWRCVTAGKPLGERK